MKTIINNRGVETLIFAETFEFEAYEQIKKLCNFEAYDTAKIRIMPDAHAGKGCTVGTTMTISDKVTPNLVGVDIGCGMLTVKLKDEQIDFAILDQVIKENVPCGFNINTTSKAKFDFDSLRIKKGIDLQRASLSIGSLGGGNHFIEVGKMGDDYYLIIHSGSRKLGGDVCKYYQDLAFQNVNEMRGVREKLIEKLKQEGRSRDIGVELKNIKKPSADKDLAFLTGSDFDDYMNDMKIVQQFAVKNRETIANTIISKMGFTESERFETIHNYIDFDRMILRKGAVSAEFAETLLIPINMRDGSLLCIGKGNSEWNYSAPHGAGRLMSRSKARETLSMPDFVNAMDGVYSSSVCTETIDEAPDAYKSMDEIINTISDTVTIIGIIKPVYNFKAH